VTEAVWQEIKGQGTRDKGQGIQDIELLINADWPTTVK